MAVRLDADQVDQVGSTFAGEWTRHGHEYFQQLRRKLRWQLLVAYVTPLIVLSLYFHFQYNATLSKGVETHLRSIAENQRNTVDLFLQERVSNLKNAFERIAPGKALSPEEREKVPAGLRGESATFKGVDLSRPSQSALSILRKLKEIEERKP